MTRLAHQYPAVAAVVVALSRDELTVKVRRLAHKVATIGGVLRECEEAGDLAALVDGFDEAAWDAQSATEPSASRSHEEQFVKARAVDAWRLAMLENTLDCMTLSTTPCTRLEATRMRSVG